MVGRQAPVQRTSEPFQPGLPLFRLFRFQVRIRVDAKTGRTKLLPQEMETGTGTIADSYSIVVDKLPSSRRLPGAMPAKLFIMIFTP
ncbi:Uncharacterised protein [Citrobacter koseri]|uniref:Uncharacterized protein n=1 Tax=Citrobacter koseri TaxID=545 RepID=A0A2X2X7Y3_CITKO|nr:Uncharacterised protein [Citrobacter koseri]